MKRLIYLSPVPWASFAQRPQKFIEWFHTCTGGSILWIDPYPTRFPRLSDLQRLKFSENSEMSKCPNWVEVVKPTALPLEPLPGSGWVNAFFWQKTINRIVKFAEGHETLIVVGKPSLLALLVLKKLKEPRSIYDSMDDFPSFYRGFTRNSVERRELRLVKRVSDIWVTSTQLKKKWKNIRSDLHFVPNALDTSLLPPISIKIEKNQTKIFGYVGTIAEWFDWNWIVELAKVRAQDTIRLIGPVFHPARMTLPENIEILPERPHAAALHAMLDFDVGLIPFIKNDLTASVDPIKFYEYRALGLPVMSTNFGEMTFRANEPGTFISEMPEDVGAIAELALCFQDDSLYAKKFSIENSWENRFNATKLLT